MYTCVRAQNAPEGLRQANATWVAAAARRRSRRAVRPRPSGIAKSARRARAGELLVANSRGDPLGARRDAVGAAKHASRQLPQAGRAREIAARRRRRVSPCAARVEAGVCGRRPPPPHQCRIAGSRPAPQHALRSSSHRVETNNAGVENAVAPTVTEFARREHDSIISLFRAQAWTKIRTSASPVALARPQGTAAAARASFMAPSARRARAGRKQSRRPARGPARRRRRRQACVGACRNGWRHGSA